jgi:hypothetical protein
VWFSGHLTAAIYGPLTPIIFILLKFPVSDGQTASRYTLNRHVNPKSADGANGISS